MNIKKRKAELDEKFRKLLLEKKKLDAELEYIIAMCEHPNLRTWTSTDYAGGADHHRKCDDCGYHSIT